MNIDDIKRAATVNFADQLADFAEDNWDNFTVWMKENGVNGEDEEECRDGIILIRSVQ